LATVYRHVQEYLSGLPHCADITRKYCQKYSGILLVDGKFVKIKGYERKLPVIYGVDYQTHDIPSYKLGRSENLPLLTKFFTSLKLLNYPLQAVVCDDNQAIRDACLRAFPSACVQLCQNHYKQNVRVSLDLKANETYLPFMRGIEDLFLYKRAPDDFNKRAKELYIRWKDDGLCTRIMVDIYKTRDLLLGWHNLKGVPTTTNLIECFNSHLQGRLKSIKGFESFSHADTWLNAYFLRRRTKKFKDCTGKFTRLNGKTSLQISKKPGIDVPSFF